MSIQSAPAVGTEDTAIRVGADSGNFGVPGIKGSGGHKRDIFQQGGPLSKAQHGLGAQFIHSFSFIHLLTHLFIPK